MKQTLLTPYHKAHPQRRHRTATLLAATGLILGLLAGRPALGKPALDSMDVLPNPLNTGQLFTIAVTASPDVTQANAAVDFHPGNSPAFEIPLLQQGQVWTGAGLVPASLDQPLPGKAGAHIRVTLLDARGQRTEAIGHFAVHVTSISAVFAGGILTVTGDDDDNNLVVSRDASGGLLVNGGNIPVQGGIATVANTTLIRVLGLGGNDALSIDDSNGPMPPANLLGGDGDDTLTGSASDDELDGGPGNDTLFGRDGNDILIGGPGNDILVGGRGNDTMFGGEGDDQFVWNPGDGSDVIEGEDGDDTLLFNGSNVGEVVDLSANGARLRFFRNVANITMDCAGIEQVIFHALGGADQVTVNDLTGTEVKHVDIDLSDSLGSPDGQADTVIVNGTDASDTITLTGSSAGVEVNGLASSVQVTGFDPGIDELVINGLKGDDLIDASAVQAGAIDLTLHGGDGDDILKGGDGNDLLAGDRGDDVEFGGAGDDTFVWNPGDGNDVIEGQAGQDTLLFNGANVGETIDIAANGQRVRFSRDVANITMDCNEIEFIQFQALGGADSITVHDLTGTGVTQVNLDLAAVPGSGTGDTAADTVIIEGTNGDDVVTINGTSAGIDVTGLPASVSITASEPALDQLIVRLLGGNDIGQASGLQDGLIRLTLDGGPGDDVLIGSQGADTLLGGDGDDVLFGGPGADILDGGPGNNVLIQD